MASSDTGTGKGGKPSDVTDALKRVEAEEKRVAKERERAVKEALKEVERAEKEAAQRRKDVTNAAFAAAARGADILRAGFNVLGSTMGAINAHVTRFVQLANPAAVLRFNLALADTQAVIGRALTPTLNQLTGVVRAVGNAIAGLDGNGQKVIASIAAGTVGLVLFGGAMLAVQTIASGGILPIITAVIGAFGGVAFVMGDFGAILKDIGQIFTGVMNKLGGVLAQFAGSGALGAVAVALAEVLGAVVDVGASILAGLMPAMNAFAGVIQLFTPMITTVVAMWGALTRTFVDVWAKGVTMIFQEVTPYILAFGRIMMDVYRTIYRGVQSLLAFVGVNLPDFGTGSAPREKTGKSEGAAVRSTSTQDVSSVLAKARELAFMAGTGAAAQKDPATRSANYLESIDRKASEIKQEIERWLSEAPAAIGNAVYTAWERVKSSATQSVSNFGNDLQTIGAIPNSVTQGRLPSVGEVATSGGNLLRALFD